MKLRIFCSLLFFSSSAWAWCPKDTPSEAPLEKKNKMAMQVLNHYKVDIDSLASIKSVPASYKVSYKKTHKYALDPFCNGGTLHTQQNFVINFDDGSGRECFEAKMIQTDFRGDINRSSKTFKVVESSEACNAL